MSVQATQSPPAALARAPAAAHIHALVPCAGTGSRAGQGMAKQYRPVAGQAMVLHTLAAFQAVPRLASRLVCVTPGDTVLAGQAAAMGFVLAECGGATRAATVRRGLAVLRERGAAGSDWVLVHDAARCLITPELIERLIAACEADAVGGLLAQPLADTLKQAGDGQRVAATVPRNGLWLAQTPQMFRIGVLADALDEAGDAVTDEAGAIEAAGHRPLLVPGSARNFKVTWPEDFALAEALLLSRQGSIT